MSVKQPSLDSLEIHGDFIRRHIGSDSAQIAAICKQLGIDQAESILAKAVPESILTREPFSGNDTLSEEDVIARLGEMRNINHVYTSMIGMGYSGTIMPAVI